MAKPRRPPPPLLDPLTAADRAADQWLAEHGVRWRWPRVQGAASLDDGPDDDQARVAARLAAASGQPVRDPTVEALEAEQALAALRAARLIDAAWHRTQAPPATCGDDAPALPVADAAERLGCSRRTVQTHMQARHDIEDAGQMVLPGLPNVSEVYRARPRANANEEAIHGC